MLTFFDQQESAPEIFFSIIVPARNEDKRISECLKSILNQNYAAGQFEILVIDDNSTDNTVKLASLFDKVKVISLTENEQGKKTAIEKGVQAAKGEHIVITDADTIRGEYWLKGLSKKNQQSETTLLTGPVLYKIEKNNFFEHFQYFDQIAMTGIAASSLGSGKSEMANGANMVFKKSFFEKAKPFESNKDFPGGDDIFLLLKALEKDEKVAYSFDYKTIVFTFCAENFKSFFNQRKRWIAKSKLLGEKRIFITLTLVYFFHLMILASLVFSIFNPIFLQVFLVMFLLKSIADYLFISAVAKHFKENLNILLYPFIQILHIVYVLIAGVFSISGNFEWKERKYDF